MTRTHICKSQWVHKPAEVPFADDQLKAIFKKHDKNGDGRLCRKEVRGAFEELGALIPKWRAWRGLCNADANGDGFITDDELNELVKYAMQFGYTVKNPWVVNEDLEKHGRNYERFQPKKKETIL